MSPTWAMEERRDDAYAKLTQYERELCSKERRMTVSWA